MLKLFDNKIVFLHKHNLALPLIQAEVTMPEAKPRLWLLDPPAYIQPTASDILLLPELSLSTLEEEAINIRKTLESEVEKLPDSVNFANARNRVEQLPSKPLIYIDTSEVSPIVEVLQIVGKGDTQEDEIKAWSNETFGKFKVKVIKPTSCSSYDLIQTGIFRTRYFQGYKGWQYPTINGFDISIYDLNAEIINVYDDSNRLIGSVRITTPAFVDTQVSQEELVNSIKSFEFMAFRELNDSSANNGEATTFEQFIASSVADTIINRPNEVNSIERLTTLTREDFTRIYGLSNKIDYYMYLSIILNVLMSSLTASSLINQTPLSITQSDFIMSMLLHNILGSDKGIKQVSQITQTKNDSHGNSVPDACITSVVDFRAAWRHNKSAKDGSMASLVDLIRLKFISES